MIEFRKVSKHYGAQDVLVDASFQISPGDRVGLVGPNGAGKSTVFGLILGEVAPDDGEVFVADRRRLGYLRQVLNVRDEEVPLLDYVADALPELREIDQRIHAVEHELAEAGGGEGSLRAKLIDEMGDLQHRYEVLGGYEMRTRAQEALGGLGFSADALMHGVGTFSGGWQMRAELARVLVARPGTLLLDEPSNYLDLPAVEWLQRFLRDFEGTLVLISHDRFLLNTLTRRTLEINAGRATAYAGNYDTYQRDRVIRVEQALARKENQDQKRRQVERFVERFRAKASKAAQVQSRVKMLEKMEDVEEVDDLAVRGRIRLPDPPHCGIEVIRLEQAGLTYDGQRWVLRDVELSVQRGEKLALVGHNGLGKTTLLRMLAGALPLSEGKRILGHQVTPGYQTQDFAEAMNERETVLQTVRAVAPDRPERELRGLLGGFGFSGAAIEKTVGVLSGGEKIRLAFARLLVKPPNLLLLDEPTTHLDIHAREALEEALREYPGTMLVVSHDVAFVRRVATGILEMKPPGVRRFAGDYDYYREKIAAELVAAKTGVDGAPVSSTRLAKRERAERIRETAARKRVLEAAMRKAEATITRLENEQAELVGSLECGAGKSFAEINQRLTALPGEIAEATAAWERAALECEELNQNRP
ncbi:MAG TPA: ABC-F family ATP-binding cassette domain-containing protein [Kiritimatiellia bacterium]|nr:ABC-F family ATP-binding cassette domain-containing protein [Kiritimatiellia bacterium]HMO99737.1 ABC-F family ATP-binding cassette domain-containing protein [Kiritimatiellia bacterium]HMP97530.1 ABC-F family ATP-binding cassette domain-containing protein [Kiritimatiellia bacterium]